MFWAGCVTTFSLGLQRSFFIVNPFLIDNGILSRNVCRLDLFDNSFIDCSSSLNIAIGSKRMRMNGKSSMWHKCLGHISRNQLKRLKGDEILENLDFLYFHTCVDCING